MAKSEWLIWNYSLSAIIHSLLFIRKRDVGLEGERKAVLCAGAHDERAVALQDLQVVHVTVISAVCGVVADDFELFPFGLEVVFNDFSAVAAFAQSEGGGDTVAAMWCGDAKDVAHHGIVHGYGHGFGCVFGD